MDGQKDRNTQRIELVGKFHDGGPPETLAINHDARLKAFGGLKPSVTVRVQSRADETKSQIPLPVLDRLDVHSRKSEITEFPGQTAHADCGVVPSVAAAHEAQNQRVVLCDGSGCGEMAILLPGAQDAGCCRGGGNEKQDQKEPGMNGLGHACHHRSGGFGLI